MKNDKTKKKKFPHNVNEKRAFISRSIHGSGAFSDANVNAGYRCEPEYGSSGSGHLLGKKVVFEGLKGD